MDYRYQPAVRLSKVVCVAVFAERLLMELQKGRAMYPTCPHGDKQPHHCPHGACWQRLPPCMLLVAACGCSGRFLCLDDAAISEN
jgi:hypothetical protein